MSRYKLSPRKLKHFPCALICFVPAALSYFSPVALKLDARVSMLLENMITHPCFGINCMRPCLYSVPYLIEYRNVSSFVYTYALSIQLLRCPLHQRI